jgi:hypothetical protein
MCGRSHTVVGYQHLRVHDLEMSCYTPGPLMKQMCMQQAARCIRYVPMLLRKAFQLSEATVLGNCSKASKLIQKPVELSEAQQTQLSKSIIPTVRRACSVASKADSRILTCLVCCHPFGLDHQLASCTLLLSWCALIPVVHHGSPAVLTSIISLCEGMKHEGMQSELLHTTWHAFVQHETQGCTVLKKAYRQGHT